MPWSYRYVIRGRVVAKKNSHRIRRRGNVTFIGNSREYLDWADAAIVQVRLQRGRTPTIERSVPLRALLTVYLGRGQRIDSDNATSGPFDVLQQAGVIANDNQIVSHTTTKARDWRDPRVEVELTPYTPP